MKNPQSLRTRTRNSSWQWLMIGAVLGVGCMSVACLGAYVLGVVQVRLPGSVIAELATPSPQPTYTPYPTYTAQPTVNSVLVTPAAAGASTSAPIVSTSLVQIGGTATPFAPLTTPIPIVTDNSTPLVGGSAVPRPTNAVIATLPPILTAAPGGSGSAATLPFQASDSQERTAFLNAASPLALINGGIVELGTDPAEVTRSVRDCVERDKGKCTTDDATDSSYPHKVVLNNFEIEKTEVSVDQFILFLNTLPVGASYKTACGTSGQKCFEPFDNANFKGSPVKLDSTIYKPASELQRDRPMVFVTWFGAESYCKALGRRLPTEAEWERSARRFTEDNKLSLYPWGNQWDQTLANSNRGGPNTATATTDYASGASNEGVLNLSGNASEWVADWYDKNYYRDNKNWDKPKGPLGGTTKVVRGGSWATTPFFLRSVHRQDKVPTVTDVVTGFRCAQDAGGVPASNTTGGGAAPVATQPPAAIPTRAVGTLTP